MTINSSLFEITQFCFLKLFSAVFILIRVRMHETIYTCLGAIRFYMHTAPVLLKPDFFKCMLVTTSFGCLMSSHNYSQSKADTVHIKGRETDSSN